MSQTPLAPQQQAAASLPMTQLHSQPRLPSQQTNRRGSFLPTLTTLPPPPLSLPKKPPVPVQSNTPVNIPTFTPPHYIPVGPSKEGTPRSSTVPAPPSLDHPAVLDSSSLVGANRRSGEDPDSITEGLGTATAVFNDKIPIAQSPERQRINNQKAAARTDSTNNPPSCYGYNSAGDPITDGYKEDQMERLRQKVPATVIKSQQGAVRLSPDPRIDAELQLIRTRILAGVTELSDREEQILMTETKNLNSAISSLIGLAVNRVTNRSRGFTVKIAWYYHMLGNSKNALRIVQSLLEYQPMLIDDDLMSMDEVNDLMEYQFIVENLERRLGYRN